MFESGCLHSIYCDSVLSRDVCSILAILSVGTGHRKTRGAESGICYRHARCNCEDNETAAQSSAYCPLFIDRVVAFGKSENQDWPFAKILVLGKLLSSL